MNETIFCMFLLHSSSNFCAWRMASSCLVSMFSSLSSREQMVEMDSLSFWMLLVSSLVVVMELVALELEATEAHVCLAGTSGFRPFDVSENESTDLIAYCSNGSSVLSKTIVVLKRTSVWKSGESLLVCIFGRLS